MADSRRENGSPSRGRRADRIVEYQVEQENTLLNFLFSLFPTKSKTTVKSYLSHKQVAVNVRPTSQFDTPLKPGDVVAINFDNAFTEFSHPRLKLIYEDEYLIVVNKGYGLLSMSTDRIKENTAYHLLSDYVKTTNPANRLFILHRLDRDTSGVMMFAKRKDLQEYMQRNWNNVVTDRKYVAIVEGHLPQAEGEIRSYLTENAAFQVYSTPNESEGQLAITNFEVLQTTSKHSLVELELETGRKNQIRVHLKELGNPIIGDRKYGAGISPIGRLALHASRLAFIHPVTQKNMVFDVPIPRPFVQLMQQKRRD